MTLKTKYKIKNCFERHYNFSWFPSSRSDITVFNTLTPALLDTTHLWTWRV